MDTKYITIAIFTFFGKKLDIITVTIFLIYM
jgi:hypothetical protein